VSTTVETWRSRFGDDYARRNAPDVDAIKARIKWLKRIEALAPGIESVFEAGCGQGVNLAAWRLFAPNILRYGCEPNDKARETACTLAKSPDGIARYSLPEPMPYKDREFGLVMTCGVLIHIPPADLLPSMRELYRVSKGYIMCAEYFAPGEEEIEYHGKKGLLWRRPYGDIWVDNFDLYYVSHGFLWDRVDGMDNVTWWLFKKG
jgi:pseudaminic acid biosynthesis-associated methylase